MWMNLELTGHKVGTFAWLIPDTGENIVGHHMLSHIKAWVLLTNTHSGTLHSQQTNTRR